MESTKIVLSANNGQEELHLSTQIIGGYSINNNENQSYATVFFRGGMSWPIDNNEDNLKQLRTLKL